MEQIKDDVGNVEFNPSVNVENAKTWFKIRRICVRHFLYFSQEVSDT